RREAGGIDQSQRFLAAEAARDLGADAFAAGKLEGAGEAPEPDLDRLSRHQPHLDAPLLDDVRRVMIELLRIEVAARERVDVEELLRTTQRGRAEVDGDVPGTTPRRERGVEQRDRLGGGAAAELDHIGELATTRRLDDGARSRLEQRPLRPRGKVLGQARDLLEERAARVVVEVLAGDLAWGAQERVAQLAQGPALRVEPDQPRRPRRLRPGQQGASHAPGRRSPFHHIPPAQRSPLGISRTPASYQLRRLGRNRSGELAHEPPRSTRWVPNQGTEYPSYG